MKEIIITFIIIGGFISNGVSSLYHVFVPTLQVPVTVKVESVATSTPEVKPKVVITQKPKLKIVPIPNIIIVTSPIVPVTSIVSTSTIPVIDATTTVPAPQVIIQQVPVYVPTYIYPTNPAPIIPPSTTMEPQEQTYSITINPSLGDVSANTNRAQVRIASFNVSSNQVSTLGTITVGINNIPLYALSTLQVSVDGNFCGYPRQTSSINLFPVAPTIQMGANEVKTIDVYADTSNYVLATSTPIVTLHSVGMNGVENVVDIQGQNVTIN